MANNTKAIGVAFADPLFDKADVTGALTAGSLTVGGKSVSSTWTTGEVPSGTMNGINKVFTLAHTPVTGITLIYNNATQFYTTDYTLSGTTITLGAGVTAPNTANGDTLYVLPYAY